MDFNFFKNMQQQSQQSQQPNMNQIRQILQIIGNRNPKEVFYELCKQKGVDPNEILKKLK